MPGRAGSSGHQNLIRMASRRLLNDVLGDEYLAVTLVREQPLDARASLQIHGEGSLGGMRITDTTQRLYADIACAATFDTNSRWLKYAKDEDDKPSETILKLKEEGKWDDYRVAVRSHYGVISYVIECEMNPRSNLLRDGPRLTAYKLIKEKNPNFILVLAVFEGTKVDNPEIFDMVWEFPHKGD